MVKQTPKGVPEKSHTQQGDGEYSQDYTCKKLLPRLRLTNLQLLARQLLQNVAGHVTNGDAHVRRGIVSDVYLQVVVDHRFLEEREVKQYHIISSGS